MVITEKIKSFFSIYYNKIEDKITDVKDFLTHNEKASSILHIIKKIAVIILIIITFISIVFKLLNRFNIIPFRISSLLIVITLLLLLVLWFLPYLFTLIGHLKYKTQRKIWGVVFLMPWIIGFLLFFLKPLIETFIFSFQKVSPSDSGLIIENVGLKNYYRAFRENVDFTPSLIGSAQVTVINLVVISIFSLLMAVVLNSKFKGRTFIRAVFFIPVIFNSSAVTAALGGGEALRNIMERNGMGVGNTFNFEAYLLEANIATGLIVFLISSITSIYSVVSLSGVQILIYLAGIQSIPGHLYEAAKIEGATSYEIFWKITLPMVSPMIITTAVYTIVDTFLRTSVTEVIADTGVDYGLNAAMSWVYFGVSSIILAVVLFILSKVVFYYDE
jgi:ABC-type sugar transport system permease subunit